MSEPPSLSPPNSSGSATHGQTHDLEPDDLGYGCTKADFIGIIYYHYLYYYM